MQRPWFVIGWPVLCAVIVAVAVLFVSNGQLTKKFSEPSEDPLWAIQPGLGTVMIEYGTRFNNAWWAAEGGSWSMAGYQLKEMTEIQEVGETTRPKRADALKKFENDSLKPLIAAAQRKDISAFRDAYDKTITGCNKCHGEQKDSAGNDFRWIVIQRPTSGAPFSNVNFKQ